MSIKIADLFLHLVLTTVISQFLSGTVEPLSTIDVLFTFIKVTVLFGVFSWILMFLA